MNNFNCVGRGLLLGLALAGTSPNAIAAERVPVVIELFTSQGCSSCPPANANLIELSKNPDILTLSFSVTYWDYLGWKDVFGKPEFTDRQVIYEPALGKAGPFTPQMVINGRATAVGNELDEMERLVAATGQLDGPAISLKGSKVIIGNVPETAAQADVWLVRYDPNLVEVPVGRGENTGATLPHIHVVHSLQRLGDWHGSAVTFDLPKSADKLKAAILVQHRNGGPILSAATN
jgi:hypothetical protein